MRARCSTSSGSPPSSPTSSLPDGGRRWLAEPRPKRPRLRVLVVTAEPWQALGLDRVYGLADAVLGKPAEPRVLVAMLDRMAGPRGAS
ncbi:MAG TPA: hypothetical protein VL049_19985 [Candidatus Dormibacteraeota bacterium]|nr:hypothetical protein [Candidatus Dormibacteraeota bacterium]